MRHGLGNLIAPASIACAAVAFAIAATGPAIAADWANVATLGGGLDLCLDKAGVQTHADGLTYFSTKFCFDDDGQAALHAVRCNQDWSGDSVAIRERSRLPNSDGSWLWIDQQEKSASMIAISAKVACGKK